MNFNGLSSAYPIISFGGFTYHRHNSKHFSAAGNSMYQGMDGIFHRTLREQ